MERLLKSIKKERKLAVGLMSGTSLDGIDACLVSIEGSGKNTKIEIIDFITENFTLEEKVKILRLCSPETSNVVDICYMNVYLGKKFGFAAKKIIEKNDFNSDEIDFISSHGQTVYHMPEKNATLQIGELSEIAAITGCLTIGDYRPSDVAVGGQGAPLVPFVDYILFRDNRKNRILLNIGGISNLTIIEANAEMDDIVAFDCGPGNMIIDRAISILTNGEYKYDPFGEFALKGNINTLLLDKLINEDDFVLMNPPKSTGREQYNENFVEKLLIYKESSGIGFEDFIATITAYTYKSIAINIEKFSSTENREYEIFVGGGGANNKAIMQGIKELTGFPVYTMDEIGFSADAKEAAAFAILGNEFLASNANNLKNTTGARSDVIMGKMTFPPLG